MSDDDRDIDIDSDDDDSDSRQRQAINTQGFSQAEKRAHHNALERKRRDHIKDSFSNLRETVPALQGEKVASRAQILKKAADHIQQMRRKIFSHQKDINDLTRQNRLLESQIRTLEKAKLNGNFPVDPCEIKSELPETDDYHSESSDSDDDARTVRVTKKMKIATTMH